MIHCSAQRERCMAIIARQYRRSAAWSRDAVRSMLLSGQSHVEIDRARADPERQVERNLIVAASARVQLPTRLPDPLDQRRLDDHMDVLEALVELEGPRLDVALDPLEPLRDLVAFGV